MCIFICRIDIIIITNSRKLVRLGEYDTSNEDEDCVDVGVGGKDCTEGVTKIDVEAHIIHEEYDVAKRKNDIALLRLAEMAPYTGKVNHPNIIFIINGRQRPLIIILANNFFFKYLLFTFQTSSDPCVFRLLT